jgi:hypothetical protein
MKLRKLIPVRLREATDQEISDYIEYRLDNDLDGIFDEMGVDMPARLEGEEFERAMDFVRDEAFRHYKEHPQLVGLQESLDGKMQLSEKAAFLEEVSRFNEYGKTIYRMEGMRQAAEAINKIVEKAQQVALQETEEWFDEVTIKRNMKSLKSNNEVFQKTVREAAKLQQRLESLYEEMGNTLSRYYEIRNTDENL